MWRSDGTFETPLTAWTAPAAPWRGAIRVWMIWSPGFGRSSTIARLGLHLGPRQRTRSQRRQARALHLLAPRCGRAVARAERNLAVWLSRSSRMTLWFRGASRARASAWSHSSPSTTRLTTVPGHRASSTFAAPQAFRTVDGHPSMDSHSPRTSGTCNATPTTSNDAWALPTPSSVTKAASSAASTYTHRGRTPGSRMGVRSWVNASCVGLDLVLHEAVADWLATEWPFTNSPVPIHRLARQFAGRRNGYGSCSFHVRGQTPRSLSSRPHSLDDERLGDGPFADSAETDEGAT
jgi:hypothetical protein